eukprot:COSAG06_NODE_11526_length_1497_cov_1.502146_3_plen_103_part_00
MVRDLLLLLLIPGFLFALHLISGTFLWISLISGTIRSLRLHATCNAGVPLIFDEIVSGFRYAPGGAQEKYSVTPDLACVAKIVAGYVLLPSPISLVKDDGFT